MKQNINTKNKDLDATIFAFLQRMPKLDDDMVISVDHMYSEDSPRHINEYTSIFVVNEDLERPWYKDDTDSFKTDLWQSGAKHVVSEYAKELGKNESGLLWVPVYRLPTDNGIALAITEQEEDTPENAELIGFIYEDLKQVQDELGSDYDVRELKEMLRPRLAEEIQIMSDYLSGKVFSISLHKEIFDVAGELKHKLVDAVTVYGDWDLLAQIAYLIEANKQY